jgi:serine protease Do
VARVNDDIKVLKRTSRAFTEVAKKAIPAVVYIKVEKTFTRPGFSGRFNDPFELFDEDFLRRFFGGRLPQQQPKRKYRQQGQGSGFIISENGYILTNNHVVGDSDKITVRLQDKQEFKAKLIGTDPKSDVAVIKIDADDLPTISLGNSDDLQVGEWVIAIGNPFGLLETVTVGVVSAKGRGTVGIADYENYIQTDAAINPGNSGGPLINLDGEAVGINSAIYSRTGGYMGIGFSIPINMAINIKDQLVKRGKVIRGYLGIFIQEVTKEIADSFGFHSTQGVLVSGVTPDSPAYRGGIKQGDILVELNDKPVEGLMPFRNKIALTKPYTEVKLKIFRDNDYIIKYIKVGILPDESETASMEEEPSTEEELSEKFGFSVQELTKELAEQFNYALHEGVIISSVEENSPASDAGLRPGLLIVSVNRKKVDSLEEFKKALEQSDEKNSVLLFVKGEDFSRYVVLKID